MLQVRAKGYGGCRKLIPRKVSRHLVKYRCSIHFGQSCSIRTKVALIGRLLRYKTATMKKIILIVLLALSYSAQAGVSKIMLQASGLTCSMCSKSIFKALQTLPFVSKITSNIQTSSFEIEIKNNETPNFDAVKEKVEAAGFFVAEFTVVLNAAVPIDGAVDTHQQLESFNVHILKTNSNKTSISSFKIVDKGFLSAKAFKKIEALTKQACIKTGRAEQCCSNVKGISVGDRIFHITI